MNFENLLIEIDTLRGEVDRSSENLIEARKSLLLKSGALEDAKHEIEIELAAEIRKGNVAGNNVEERQADLIGKFEHRHRAIHALEKGYASAKKEYDVASLELQRIKLNVRLIESATKVHAYDS